MEKHIDYISNNNVCDKLAYINKLPIITIVEILNSYAIQYVEPEIVMFIILKSLQHEMLGIKSLEERYHCPYIHDDIILFSHIDEIYLYMRHVRSFILFLKRKQKYAWRYIPKILNKTKYFSNLSYDLKHFIGNKYLGCPWKDLEQMAHRLGIVLAVLDNIKRCHIEYYYMTNIWEEMADQANQQGAIDAIEAKEIFMKNYNPCDKLIKWKIIPCNVCIDGDFYTLYKRWLHCKHTKVYL